MQTRHPWIRTAHSPDAGPWGVVDTAVSPALGAPVIDNVSLANKEK